MSAVPERLTLFPNAEIGIVWSDGREDFLPGHMVRSACPCATCVDEMTGRPLLDPASVPADVRADSWSPVGRYAVQFRWSDGHESGLYTFDALRRLGVASSQ